MVRKLSEQSDGSMKSRGLAMGQSVLSKHLLKDEFFFLFFRVAFEGNCNSCMCFGACKNFLVIGSNFLQGIDIHPHPLLDQQGWVGLHPMAFM